MEVVVAVDDGGGGVNAQHIASSTRLTCRCDVVLRTIQSWQAGSGHEVASEGVVVSFRIWTSASSSDMAE